MSSNLYCDELYVEVVRNLCWGRNLRVVKCDGSFLALSGDLSCVVLIVLHSLDWSDLWSSVSTNCLYVCIKCSFVDLFISSFIFCMAGEVGYINLMLSRAPIFSNISGYMVCYCFRMMARKTFSPF